MTNISNSSLDTRMEELSRQLKQKDEQLDQELDEAIQADFDAIDRDIESDNKNLREGLRLKVEAVKKGIKDRKDGLRQKVEEAKKGSKDRARKEAEDSLNRMELNLSKEDLESAYVDLWVANQWLKASK
jgi:hypothetical protein